MDKAPKPKCVVHISVMAETEKKPQPLKRRISNLQKSVSYFILACYYYHQNIYSLGK